MEARSNNKTTTNHTTISAMEDTIGSTVQEVLHNKTVRHQQEAGASAAQPRRFSDPNFATAVTRYKRAYAGLLKAHRMMMAGQEGAKDLHDHYFVRCDKSKLDLSPLVVAKIERSIDLAFGLEEG